MEIKVRFPNLGFMFQYEDSTISVLGFEVTIYGLLIAAGMLLGILFVIAAAKRQKQNVNRYLEASILSILGGVIGARLYYVAFSWENFSGRSWKMICDISSGGMAIYGGIFGAALVTAIYCRIRRLSFGQVADTLSVGLLIGQIIGIWGNFFNREGFGEYTESLFAMRLPFESVQSSAVTEKMMNNRILIDGVEYIQAHPLAVYECAWCLILLLILLIYTARKKFQGEIFLRYLSGYGLGKCLIEWLRTDALCIPGTEISVSFVISAVLFVVCGIMAVVRRKLWKQRAKVYSRRQEVQHTEEAPDEETVQNEETEETSDEETVQNEETEEASDGETVQNEETKEALDEEIVQNGETEETPNEEEIK